MKYYTTHNTREVVLWSLQKAAKLYAGEIYKGVKEICEGMMKIELGILDKRITSIVVKDDCKLEKAELAKEISETFLTENYIDDHEHNRFVENMLDLVLRISLGQWEELNQVVFSNDVKFFMDEEDKKELEKIKINYFGAPIGFGIGSTMLKNDVRILYDFYKVLMYEMGEGGVYSYDVIPMSKENLPLIEFKPKKSWYITKEEDLLKIYNELTDKERKNADLEGYFRTSDNVFINPRPGETLILKKNGLFKVIQGKLKADN